MRGIIKTILGCLFLSLGFSGLTGTTAFAAAERIDNARITFSYDQAPKAGEAPGTVAAATTSKEFTVESAKYANDTDRWTLGDRPEVTVILNASALAIEGPLQYITWPVGCSWAVALWIPIAASTLGFSKMPAAIICLQPLYPSSPG